MEEENEILGPDQPWSPDMLFTPLVEEEEKDKDEKTFLSSVFVGSEILRPDVQIVEQEVVEPEIKPLDLTLQEKDQMEFANLVYNQGKKLKEEGVFEMPENLNVLQESIDVPEDQNIEEYFKNQVELEKDKQVLEDVKKKSWINKVGSIDLAKGSTSLGEMMFGIGETMYDLFAFPQNKLVQMGVLGDDWEVSSEEFKEKFGIENRLLEFYQKETEKLEQHGKPKS